MGKPLTKKHIKIITKMTNGWNLYKRSDDTYILLDEVSVYNYNNEPSTTVFLENDYIFRGNTIAPLINKGYLELIDVKPNDRSKVNHISLTLIDEETIKELEENFVVLPYKNVTRQLNEVELSNSYYQKLRVTDIGMEYYKQHHKTKPKTYQEKDPYEKPHKDRNIKGRTTKWEYEV